MRRRDVLVRSRLGEKLRFDSSQSQTFLPSQQKILILGAYLFSCEIGARIISPGVRWSGRKNDYSKCWG